jgi:chaperonin GroES
MKLVPLEDRVIVKVMEEEERTVSGIVLPDTAKEKPQKATVRAVGPGRYDGDDLIPIDLAEGDVVIFAKYGGTEVKVDGEELLILRASDILAKLV